MSDHGPVLRPSAVSPLESAVEARFGTVTATAKTAEKNAALFAGQKSSLANHEIAAKILRQKWPEELLATAVHANTPLEKDGVKYFNTDMPTFTVAPENAVEVLRFFRDTKDFSYDFLLDLTSIDFLNSPRAQDTQENSGKRFQVVYVLRSMLSERRSATIRICVPVSENEEAPSMTSLWPGADWPEREVFDLMGIRFSGHPNLRRIVLPDNFRGHPLRKDFPVKGIGEDYLIEDLLYKRRNVD